MRKKSHISLAKYLLNSQGMEKLQSHSKAFYFGSILPDCVPTFITRRHTIEDTFHILKKEIYKLTENYDFEKGIGSYYCRHMGVITHYVADYFTLPHNSIYTGNMAEHCKYEKHLKSALFDYINSEEARKQRAEKQQFHTVNELCDFIMRMHEKYLHVIQQIKVDCEYIVSLCHKVVDEILAFFEAMQPQCYQVRIID